MKVDEIITWKWDEIFLAFWILFSILIGSNFGFFLMLITKVYYAILGKAQKYEGFEFLIMKVKGIFWIFTISTNCTIGSALTIVALTNLLEKDEEGIFLFSL